MSAIEPLLEQCRTPVHAVQLYEADEAALVTNIAAYLAEGLRRGQVAIAIVTAAHREALESGLEARRCDVAQHLAGGSLTLLDVDEVLVRLMVDGLPDALRFEQVIGSVLRRAVAANPKGVRAYGEIVGVLWGTKQFPAAIRLEQLWHHLQQELTFSLFCGYPIDVFGKHFDAGIVDALLCAHTHLLPTVRNDHLERALERAMGELLGLDSEELRKRAAACSPDAWCVVPNAEATILWLRREHPRFADTVLESAKTYYQAAVRRGTLQAI